VICVSHIK